VNIEESIQVGCLGPVAWVKIGATANHENAACVKQFLMSRFDRGCRQFVVDLCDHPGIDSTFIGMLCRLGRRIDEAGGGGVVDVINPGERNAKSIRKLGLDRYIRIDLDGDRWQRERLLVAENLSKPLTCGAPVDRIEHAELVLEAHEALIAANEENRSRFCDVVEFLRQELEVPTTEK